MPGTFLKTLPLLLLVILKCAPANTQITITPDTGALRLVQQMLGSGVAISNCRFTGANGAAGLFRVVPSSTPLGIDSGIVLSSGYVKSNFIGANRGIDYPATGTTVSNNLNRPGDTSLSAIISPNYDAAVLEFDFVPAGDSIVFRYVFASEEYPIYNCSRYNDVFAFFVSGPGITGSPNIALVPGANIPVAINSINDGTYTSGSNVSPSYCSNMGPGSPFTQYYIATRTNAYIAFNGFTTVLEARTQVQPCQQYHLKLAIADGFDKVIDSGVFLEAKSLRSSGLAIESTSPQSSTGQPYLAEGCTSGGIRVKRRKAETYALPVTLAYSGTAINGVDVPLLPATATIPANDSVVFIPISAIADYLAEGVEVLKIYVGNGCSAGTAIYLDSLEIQIKDYDTLHLSPADSAGICRNGSLQLQASAGHTTYTWQPASLLNNASIINPIASPVADSTTFVCTAIQGNCVAKDSVRLTFKKLFIKATQDIVCRNVPAGQIKLGTNWQWQSPLRFWLNAQPSQSDSTFNNLSTGMYKAYVQDATNCIDSTTITLIQSFPSLIAGIGSLVQANCTDSISGSVTVTASGGVQPYSFSVNGTAYQAANTLQASVGNHFALVKDRNGCIDTAAFQITFNNPLAVNAGQDTAICEGTSIVLQASSSVGSVSWYPTTALSNPSVLQPQASPVATTLYRLTAQYANCQKSDSVLITVRPAPIANAGADTAVCTGGSVQLHGSGGTQYQWSPATYLSNSQSDNPVVTPFATTRYRLTVTDGYKCTSLQPDEVQVRAVPAVVVFAGNDTVAAVGQPLQLTGRQIGVSSATQYTWSPVTGLTNPNILNPVALLSANQTYRLTLRTPQGCEGHDDISIKVYKGADIYVPTGFTPNSDGRNDVLRAIAVGIQTFKYFRIYNRWGQLVFATTVSEKGWDGKIDGRFQYGQSFVWMTEGIDYTGRIIKRSGSVVVVQ